MPGRRIRQLLTTGRRQRMRPARWRRTRVLIRFHHRQIVLRTRPRPASLAGLLAFVGLVVGLVLERDAATIASSIVVAAWLIYAIRVQRPIAAGWWGGPDSPPGAGVREPRRPLPMSPAGAAERPHPVI